MDRHSTTVTNVVGGCVYIRRHYYAISFMRVELQHSALCSFSPLCPLIQQKIRTLIRPRGRVRASRLELHEYSAGELENMNIAGIIALPTELFSSHMTQ